MQPKSKANHYELAFEDYLRGRGLTYIATSEVRRALTVGGPEDPRKIKNPDFIVTTPQRENALVDVKGKQLPYVDRKTPNAWENWLKGDDLEALEFWEESFGRNFIGLIVFAYWIREAKYAKHFDYLHAFGGKKYGLLALSRAEYAKYYRRRSARWDTFSIPIRIFRRIARPITDYI
ncbi:MAG: hypothetical protein E3J72_13015 [Planctomycetota bacterium]|nr:MAG: hypothetical protein E3J72_13015 [Planctomycetota bacterium]